MASPSRANDSAEASTSSTKRGAGRSKKQVDPESTARDKEKQDKKIAKVEKEKKEAEVWRISKHFLGSCLMIVFLGCKEKRSSICFLFHSRSSSDHPSKDRQRATRLRQDLPTIYDQEKHNMRSYQSFCWQSSTTTVHLELYQRSQTVFGLCSTKTGLIFPLLISFTTKLTSTGTHE